MTDYIYICVCVCIRMGGWLVVWGVYLNQKMNSSHSVITYHNHLVFSILEVSWLIEMCLKLEVEVFSFRCH